MNLWSEQGERDVRQAHLRFVLRGPKQFRASFFVATGVHPDGVRPLPLGMRGSCFIPLAGAAPAWSDDPLGLAPPAAGHGPPPCMRAADCCWLGIFARICCGPAIMCGPASTWPFGRECIIPTLAHTPTDPNSQPHRPTGPYDLLHHPGTQNTDHAIATLIAKGVRILGL